MPTSDGEGDEEPAAIEELLAALDAIANRTASDVDAELRDIEALLAVAHERALIESGVRGFGLSDVAEATVGAVILATPLLVEDGVFDIAAYLFETTVRGVPVFFAANALFVVLMTYALLEWTGRDTRELRVVLGVVPVRVVVVLAVAFVVSVALMGVWGRLGEWPPSIEAFARVTVVWTVASLGGALGDLAAGDDRSPALDGEATGRESSAADRLSDPALVEAIYAEFEDVEALVDNPALRRRVARLKRRTVGATLGGVGDRVQKYTTRDIAEALVGSVFFAIPLLVEDGVFDVAAYFLSFTVAGFPVFFVANTAFVLVMLWALVYGAGPRDVAVTRPLFGVVPRRLLGTALVSFVAVAVLMTMWGRVDGWRSPVVAVARVSVVWTVASFGAALGDILPGESSGDDINDDLAELGELVEELVD